MESLMAAQKLGLLQQQHVSVTPCSFTRTRYPRVLSMSAVTSTARKTIASTFSDLKSAGKVALIPYITAGDPSLSTTAEALVELDKTGADILELGVPYSDPLADGPVIQAAATRALRNGTTLEAVLEMLKEVIPRLTAPIVLFTYYNPILKRGIENFLQSIKAVGVTGLLVPDLPLEETDALRRLSTHYGLELVLLTTPTTPKERMLEISQASQGFVYLVSLTGVTGARVQVSSRVESLLQDLKQVTDKPVAVGFGISTPEHAIQVAQWGADGVIVGSAMVKLLGDATSPHEGIAAITNLLQNIRKALS
ncbi:hypothetical protein GOP47_0003941 [Adiantum capillus-veneris]|uniref:Tryptophan synthase n=1 Tax=Adiantum capillus-veneris TaxID=13818 RepID=A0A9D4V6X8_ADICA|nr:hypothetical protein GOP47_0003941 [Adiantum capillus-veneris]